MLAIILNKNGSKLKNRAIIAELVMSGVTIIIPIILLKFNIELNLYITPLFILLYILFRFLDNTVHKTFLQEEERKIEGEIEEEREKEKHSKGKITKYITILIIACILLYIIGELLGNTLENLCRLFNVPQLIVGILLGFITSIPELITFFESQKHHNKKENEMLGVVEATNNLLTSNTLNLFIIQAIGILIINII